MVSILILLIAALAVVVAIHLAKAKLPQYRRMDREEIEQSPNSDFSFDWGNKRKGGVTTMWFKSSVVLLEDGG